MPPSPDELDIHHLHALGGLLRPAQGPRDIKQRHHREHDAVEHPAEAERDYAQDCDDDCCRDAEQENNQVIDEKSHNAARAHAFKNARLS